MLKVFVENFVEGFDISPDGVHFALIPFSTRPRVVLSFKGLHPSMINTFMVKVRIGRMKWDRGLTFIDKALIKAQSVFTTAKGMRKGVPAVSLNSLISLK